MSSVGSPIHSSKMENSEAPAPKLGQHTEEVLSRLLAYDPDKVSALVKTGAVA